MRKNLKNKEIIEAIDKIISKRDSKTRKPQNKNAVILLTGGVDSSILADMYLSWSKSGKIYPIYIKRGAKAEKFELLSAKKVVKYFAQKYPNRIKKLVIVEAQIPPKVFKNKMDKNKVIFGGYKVRNAVLINYAVMYALMLNDNKVNVHTILIGKVSSDFFTGSRKEDLKATMLQVCLNTEDWRWKVVSPAFEPEFFKAFGFNKDISKTDLIKYALRQKFPLNLTRTCTAGSSKPCGSCEECKERLSIFASLGKSDQVGYLEMD